MYSMPIMYFLCMYTALSESTAVGSTGQRDKDRSKLVIMLAATNYPWKVDEEFRRTLVYIPLLDSEFIRYLHT